jgi:hypothetical protein
MKDKKKKLLSASVAGLLAVAGVAASANVVYAMGKKPQEQTVVNTCSGKGGCGGKNGCGGAGSCGGKNGCGSKD